MGQFVGPPDPEEPKKMHREKSQTLEQYRDLNGMNGISWNVDARFNYKDIKFRSLNKDRVQKIYLNKKRFDYFFYNVTANKKRPQKLKPETPTMEKYTFLRNLKFFN